MNLFNQSINLLQGEPQYKKVLYKKHSPSLELKIKNVSAPWSIATGPVKRAWSGSTKDEPPSKFLGFGLLFMA